MSDSVPNCHPYLRADGYALQHLTASNLLNSRYGISMKLFPIEMNLKKRKKGHAAGMRQVLEIHPTPDLDV
jgi:hypothetical protein